MTDPTAVHLAEALNQLAAVQLELDAERVLRQEVATDFDRVLTSMSDALVETDPRGVIVRANDAARELLDPIGADVVGSPVSSVVAPGVPASPWQLIDVAPSGRLAQETWLRRTDGDRVAVSLSCAVVRDSSGRATGAMYVARDLTQTQRLLRAVEGAEARWRLLADVSARLSEEVEPQAALGDVAARFARFSECDVAVILVRDTVVEEVVLADEGMASADDLTALAGRPVPAGTALARVLQDRRPMHTASLAPGYPLLSAHALVEPPASAALVPLAARDQCLGVLALLAARPDQLASPTVDLAEQLAGRVAVALTSAELRESVAELESAQRMARFRDDVLAAVSHDMKTPLAVISGSVETIQSMGEHMPPETTARLWDGVANQTRRLRRLVMQFLDYARLESGLTVLVVPRPTELAPVIDSVIDSYGNHGDFKVHVPGDLPQVRADPDRVDQVLSNVIGNALKFSPNGQPVEVTARRAGEEVEISVADRGRGISPSDLASLFQKFSRGTASEGTEGTGLGLYMSQALMAAQGGRITVASKLGEGSRFTLHFPLITENGE